MGINHTIEFWLPFPPSTNRLWRSVRGRVVIDVKYKKWKADAATSICLNNRHFPVFGAYELHVKLSVKFNRGDADNRLKAIHDIAKEVRMIVDDKFCQRTSIEWATIDHDCLVKLTGEIAYKDQWEFATAQAARLRPKARARKTIGRGLRLPAPRIR